MIRAVLLSALLSAAALAAPAPPARSDLNPAPARSEGRGPFPKLVIRGVTLIDGTGSPPYGPVDIVVENNRISEILVAGTPGLPLKPGRTPQGAEELDATGMYVLPGFVDMHAHGGDPGKAPDLEYVYKLWLAHGVTTVRGVSLAGQAVASSEKNRSARNEIAAPRIWNYQTLGSGWTGRVTSPATAREWVRWAAKNNIDGIKFFNSRDEPPELIGAAIDEAKKLGLGTVAHLSQTGVAQLDGLEAGRLGLGTITHFYGHFESLLKGRTIQAFPTDYNYLNEYDRFGQVAAIAEQSADPGSPEWTAYLEEQKKNGVTFDPTFNIYSANRDLMRARNADWHKPYTLPALWNFLQASRENHGSYFFDWTTADEVRWRNFYQKFLRLVGDYHRMGGRVTAGSDSGFIYQLYGFGYILELEHLQEAGLTPLEVVRAATFNGARTLTEPKTQAPEFGTVRRGMLADLVIVPENPLANLKVLYGTGRLRLNPQTDKQERVGGVRWTVKDGIIYDAPALLTRVREMVAEAERRDGAKVEQ